MLEILNNSAAKSGLISYKAPFVFRRDFTTNFSTKWMHKDIGLALESAQELGVPMPITSQTEQMFQAAISEGYGEVDMCATIRVMERWAGVEVRENKKYKKLLRSKKSYITIGIKPGRQLPPKRD